MQQHEQEVHEIILFLAGKDLCASEAELADFARDLIRRARVVEPHLPPIMRDAAQLKHHDDYLAVRQVAIAIGRDGKLHTSQRTDGALEYMLPLMAASRFKQQQDERELNLKLKLKDSQFENALKSICDGIASEDFQQRWETVRDKIPASAGGSRTSPGSNLILPKG